MVQWNAINNGKTHNKMPICAHAWEIVGWLSKRIHKWKLECLVLCSPTFHELTISTVKIYE
jgi:hypothetical protein